MRTRLVIGATLALDTLFFAVNLVVFAVGGSRAVLSQALYAITDVLGSLMISWGMAVSQVEADTTHPFGRGKERFFWAFTAGLVTFSLTGYLVLAMGVLQMLHPVHVAALHDALVSVGGTLLVGAASLTIILWELRRDRVSVRSLLSSDNQEMKILLVQDAVSLVGAAVVLVGIFFVLMTDNDFYDGLAAAVVGILLVGTGFVFAFDARELLVGKGVSPEEGKTMLSIIERYPYVRQVRELKSMLLGPDEALVMLRVNFVDELTTDEVEMHIDQLRRFVTSECPRIRYLIIEPAAERGVRRRDPL